MIFNTRKNLELQDNYIGGRRDFEIKSDKNEYVNVFDETYGCCADCFAVELSVYDLDCWSNPLHVCHCSLVWYNYYFDESGGIADCESRCPSVGQILASNPYHGDINAVKDACKVLTERVRWSLSDADFLTFKRAILAAFEDFCKVYYK